MFKGSLKGENEHVDEHCSPKCPVVLILCCVTVSLAGFSV